MKRRPIIIAHRGASFEAPENTMSAFHLAWHEGCDAIEGDVHKTKDNEVVVIHDEDTQRTCVDKIIIRESTLQQIQSLDCGSWKAEKFRGEIIPTLQDLIKSMPHDKKIFIEVKGGYKTLEPVKIILEDSPLKTSQIVIMDFDLENMIKARTLFPTMEILWLYEFIPPLTAANANSVLNKIVQDACAAQMHGINIELNPFITEELVNKVHDLGMKFYVWTVNEIKDALYLTDIGADGLTTDRPGLLRKLYG